MDRSILRRVAAISLAVIVFVTMLLAVCFIAEEVMHDCADEDCAVCIMIDQCEATLNMFGGAPMLFAATVLFAFAVYVAILTDNLISKHTLVTKKIRLNN